MIAPPRLWKHKETEKKLRAMPWFEVMDPMEEIAEMMKDVAPGRQVKFGTLVQIGWLLENEHGMWLGVGLKAQDAFEDLGEWVKEEKK